ncbi:MAG: CapA family protein [Clostridia bacterium]
MEKGSRSRINLSRKRFNFRDISLKKYVISISCIFVVFVILILCIINLNLDKTFVEFVDNIKNEISNTDKNINKNNEKVNIYSTDVSFAFCGEIDKHNEMYNYKLLNNVIRGTDVSFATITRLDSKLINTANMFGIDVFNLACDTVYDDNFSSNLDILKTTENIKIAGINNETVYIEKNNNKIAIVSFNDIGIKNDYISKYDENLAIEKIKEAKNNSDIVIASIHFGNDKNFGVSNKMRDIAYSLIDNNVDLVVGSHAAGAYPIVKYKDKYIIYSLGYLTTDSIYNIDKLNYIYNVNISNKKINKIELTGYYIDNQEFKLTNKIIENTDMINKWNIENGINSCVKKNKIIIEI